MEELILTSKQTKQIGFKALIFNLLEKVQVGCIKLIDENGHTSVFGSPQSTSEVAEIKVNSVEFYKKCILFGDVGFGEAYVEGLWDTESISKVIALMIKNKNFLGVQSGSPIKNYSINLLGSLNRLYHKARENTRKGSLKNIACHYDLSNEFYSLWLDPSMTYSSAIFPSADSTLEDAQKYKYERLCKTINLKKGEHLLEVGCGWGGFSEYAASVYGAKVTAITISRQQYNYAKQRILSKGLSALIDVQLCDYRNISGKYDKVVSIEMVEAVGHKFLETYLTKIYTSLKPGGVFALQAITSPDSRYNEFKNGVDWIQKHIFPGSLLNSTTRFIEASNKVSNYQLYDFLDIGLDYARTLKTWRKDFFEKLEHVKGLGFDNKFIRKWDYYLSYCEAAFETRNISAAQLVFVEPNGATLKRI